jgi:cellobiose-specific phosphotransferase system component IIC
VATAKGAARSGTKKVGTTLGLLALVVAAVTVALWFRQINQVDIPENRTTFVAFFLTAAALGVGAFVAGTRWFGGVAAVLAIFIGSFLPFTVAISRQEVAADAIRVGDTIPHFTAVDEHGQLFDSDSLRGHPVLIKFFRAHW